MLLNIPGNSRFDRRIHLEELRPRRGTVDAVVIADSGSVCQKACVAPQASSGRTYFTASEARRLQGIGGTASRLTDGSPTTFATG
jgi:hypothetical protein